MDIKIPDVTEISWPINVALAGATFSVFALIYNSQFIYYGFLTFLYGILCHLTDLAYNNWFRGIGWKTWTMYASQSVISALWIVAILVIYAKV